jgi:hypothetical protein
VEESARMRAKMKDRGGSQSVVVWAPESVVWVFWGPGWAEELVGNEGLVKRILLSGGGGLWAGLRGVVVAVAGEGQSGSDSKWKRAGR